MVRLNRCEPLLVTHALSYKFLCSYLGYGPENFCWSASEPMIVCQCLSAKIPNGPDRGTKVFALKVLTTLRLTEGRSAIMRSTIATMINVIRRKWRGIQSIQWRLSTPDNELKAWAYWQIRRIFPARYLLNHRTSLLLIPASHLYFVLTALQSR